MPVLVTAADTDLGSALVRRLLLTGGEVRAYCSHLGAVGPLRTAGAITASGDVNDEGRLEAACEQVHTVIHLGGGLLSASEDRIIEDASAVIGAAANAGVRRLIALSVVGADVGAADPLRRAKGTVEIMLQQADLPTIALRTAIIDLGELPQVVSGTPMPPDLRDHEVGITSALDLLDVLVSLDDMRSTADTGHAVLVAGATQTWRVDELRDQWSVRGSYRPLDRLPLLSEALAGSWTDDDAVAGDAWSVAGVVPAVTS